MGGYGERPAGRNAPCVTPSTMVAPSARPLAMVARWTARGARKSDRAQ
jgi:hypothetical protein